VNALRCHDAELGEVRAQGGREHGPLPHEEFAHPVQHQHRLLLNRLHRDKAHGRTRHCLGDRLRIGSVGLVALHIGLHVRGRHQPDLVPERDQLACPVVCRCTSLHADEAGRELAEVIEDLSATKAHLGDPATLGICRVDLEDLLGDVEANNANLHADGSCSKWTNAAATMARRCRLQGPSTPSMAACATSC
jgi:hypothetical protein